MVFVLLPAGTFWMGAARSGTRNVDATAEDQEGPVHEVTLSPFFLAKHEMTQGQWQRATGENPSSYLPDIEYGGRTVSPLNPVEGVSWGDCDLWLGRLGFVLPTEAQWEYAARAGTDTVWWTGNEKETLRGAANLADAYCKTTVGRPGWTYEDWLDDGHAVHSPVGSFRPNAFGFHDTIGNVFEWCRDAYDVDDYRRPCRPGDGLREAGESASARAWHALRGGAWGYVALHARSAWRSGYPAERRDPLAGVRAARAVR